MMLYLIGLVIVLLAVTNYSNPIRTYLKSIKADIALNQQQHELVRIDQRLGLVRSDLIALLASNPTVSRMRVGMIHQTISPEGNAILTWNVEAGVAAHEHTLGPPLINLPLSQWSDFLTELLNHQCALIAVSTMANDGTRARAQSLNIESFLACPVYSKKDQLLGAIFAIWDHIADVPHDLDHLKAGMNNTASHIADIAKLNE